MKATVHFRSMQKVTVQTVIARPTSRPHSPEPRSQHEYVWGVLVPDHAQLRTEVLWARFYDKGFVKNEDLTHGLARKGPCLICLWTQFDLLQRVKIVTELKCLFSAGLKMSGVVQRRLSEFRLEPELRLRLAEAFAERPRVSE